MVGDIGDELQARREGENGHCAMPHTADTRLHAWGTTREHCLTEAVRALVEAFAEVSDIHPSGVERIRLAPGGDEDLLVALLDEVVFRLEVAGRVPVDVEAEATDDGGLEVRLSLADLADVTVIGAAPKGVSWQELHIGPDPYGWTCTVIVDV
ncbi:archease [Streptomyces sp. FXJ1.172]|uniref:archease n=1 Tax=Streptomyces sp. FXJ1.172 TaxID=710705 RepID=UPI0007CFEA89|nr:archease [Streptomyces sp. FXJ1.172]WEO99615.1 archease [Streptomyces sp. FXJ1.172]